MAWGRKYLIALSVEDLDGVAISSGISLIRLISKPAQAVSQELAVAATTVPPTSVAENARVLRFINI